MPFTLSHAAAVLPAVRGDGSGRGRLVPAVLVAGSFAPDMTYFAASVVSGGMEFGTVTHSFTGVFTVDVLIAWALVGLWLVLREPLVALLPPAAQGRVAALVHCGTPLRKVSFALLARWYVSAVLGALTHVVWDAFTHIGRWGVRLLPWLTQPMAGAPRYTYLQYGSSALAAVVIAVFVAVALRRASAGSSAVSALPVLSWADRWLAAAVIGGCAAAGAVQRASRWWAYWGTHAKPWEVIPPTCFGAGAGLAVGMALYVTGVRALRRTPPDRQGTDREPARPASR
ncbi:DUF4184 family protein [Streptomyces sp. NPDC003753]|uniref:DUF4184 family protein n=1 Tax=Streptomyces sp. NPDC058960 TaxID=3346679 RepID=UPI00369B583C